MCDTRVAPGRCTAHESSPLLIVGLLCLVIPLFLILVCAAYHWVTDDVAREAPLLEYAQDKRVKTEAVEMIGVVDDPLYEE